MEESNKCLDLRRWLGMLVLGENVENEGRTVPTWKAASKDYSAKSRF